MTTRGFTPSPFPPIQRAVEKLCQLVTDSKPMRELGSPIPGHYGNLKWWAL